jgi:hypothetical protein
VRIPRVPNTVRLPPGNARWAALSGGVLVLSVMIAVIIGTLGWFGLATGDSNVGRQVDAKVITGQSCDRAGGTEVVAFQQDGRERQARFDGCGHQPGEPVQVRVPAAGADVVVHAADATPGAGNHGRGLGLLLLTVSGIAGAGYGLLIQRGPKGTPLPLLGPLRPIDLSRLFARLTRR